MARWYFSHQIVEARFVARRHAQHDGCVAGRVQCGRSGPRLSRLESGREAAPAPRAELSSTRVAISSGTPSAPEGCVRCAFSCPDLGLLPVPARRGVNRWTAAAAGSAFRGSGRLDSRRSAARRLDRSSPAARPGTGHKPLPRRGGSRRHGGLIWLSSASLSFAAGAQASPGERQDWP